MPLKYPYDLEYTNRFPLYMPFQAQTWVYPVSLFWQTKRVETDIPYIQDKLKTIKRRSGFLHTI